MIKTQIVVGWRKMCSATDDGVLQKNVLADSELNVQQKIKSYQHVGIGLKQGRQPTAHRPDPARSTFTNCINIMARLMVLLFMNRLSLQHLVLHTYGGLLMRNRTVL